MTRAYVVTEKNLVTLANRAGVEESDLKKDLDEATKNGKALVIHLKKEAWPPIDPNAPILHDWALDENGHVEYFESDRFHGGPECVRCRKHVCQHCYPEFLTELCDEQTPNLF